MYQKKKIKNGQLHEKVQQKKWKKKYIYIYNKSEKKVKKVNYSKKSKRIVVFLSQQKRKKKKLVFFTKGVKMRKTKVKKTSDLVKLTFFTFWNFLIWLFFDFDLWDCLFWLGLRSVLKNENMLSPMKDL